MLDRVDSKRKMRFFPGKKMTKGSLEFLNAKSLVILLEMYFCQPQQFFFKNNNKIHQYSILNCNKSSSHHLLEKSYHPFSPLAI